MRDHALADGNRLDLAKFKGQRHGDMALLWSSLAMEELAGLAVVVGEALRA
jgi:hypothetical protein